MDIAQATARCWLEVDLDVVASNYRSARRISGVQVIPVLKANAYGLGAARLSRLLADEGATLFAVAELGEALEVKRVSGADALVLGMIAPAQMETAVREGIIATVYDIDQAVQLSEVAVRLNLPARVHVKIDTGLHRLGFDPDNIGDILRVFDLPGLLVEGTFTHLALRVDEADAEQVRRFDAVIAAIRAEGRDPGLMHVCDSIGMVRHPRYRYDAVRPGAWLYGVVPTRYDNRDNACRPPVQFMTRVVQVRWVKKGEYLGYDEDHPLDHDMRVATLSAGYADGYPRVNNAGEVEIRGQRAPIAGLLCMDQMMVDVTALPEVVPGDSVTLLGGGISINQLSQWTGCHRNALLSGIGRRVPRVYRRDGAVESISWR